VYEPPTVTAVRRLSDSLPAVLREHHFTVDEVQVGEFGRTHGICVIARPPRAG
jgi:hypothetical protein